MIKHLIRFKKSGYVLQGVAYNHETKNHEPCSLTFESHDDALTWLENTFKFKEFSYGTVVFNKNVHDYVIDDFSIEEFTL